MSVYKPFTTSDIIVSPFEVNKSFTFQGAATLTGSGIDRFIGKNLEPSLFIPGSHTTSQISTQDQFLVYRSIRELYYSNFLENKDGSPAGTASFNTDGTITGPSYTPNYYNYLPNTLNANRFFPTGSNDEVGVISIPSNLFGENIKPGTLTYETEGITYTDDGEGGLISASLKVGDIIYEHGITTLTSVPNNINSFTTSSNITCSFESTITLYESQYKCTIRENEFNFPQNPTIISSSLNSGIMFDFATGSYFTPYVTTVGLYNNSKELVAVGKLAQPLPLSTTTDTNIIINLDM